MRSWCSPALIATVLLLTPVSLSAQGPVALTKGRASLAIDLPTMGGGQISVWRFVSSRTNVGAALSFAAGGVDSENDASRRTFSIHAGPAIKHYFSVRTRVAPFIRADAGFGFDQSSIDETPTRPAESRRGYSARGGLGFGVDWFASDDISLGANTGIAASWQRHDDSSHQSYWYVSTSSSSLSMHIYF